MYQRKRQLGEMSALKVVAVLGVLALMVALLLLMAPDTGSSVGVWEVGEPGSVDRELDDSPPCPSSSITTAFCYSLLPT